MKFLSKNSDQASRWVRPLRGLPTRIQKKVCAYLNQLTRGWSPKTIRLYWLLFILIGVSVSLEIVVRAMKGKQTYQFSKGKSEVVRLPQVPGKRGGLRNQLSRLRGCEIYLDSISKHDTMLYKKLIKESPHLRDSLDLLDSLITKNIK